MYVFIGLETLDPEIGGEHFVRDTTEDVLPRLQNGWRRSASRRRVVQSSGEWHRLAHRWAEARRTSWPTR
ncbi:MAG TPA: hypothetical protein VMS64_13310 [Candidatus Methylomirabilis sp.]|nr:hypothetical protein [Candidatus Methylomirabilis sp.]